MGLIRTAARAAVASSVHGRVQRRQQQRWAAEDQRLQQAAPAPPAVAPAAPAAPVAPAGTAELLAQLKMLGELRDSGVLTEAEFDLQKRRLLGH